MPRMRPGRIRHDIADRAIPDPFSWAYADPSDRYRTIRTIIDTGAAGMPTPAAPAQPPGCALRMRVTPARILECHRHDPRVAYDTDGHANAAYRPPLPPVRLP